MEQQPRCRNLVLDAGPLLSLTPIRGLASAYLTTPQVLSELKDPRAREHFQRLGVSGIKIDVRNPKPAALSHVIQFSKKTGDYSVLSHADLCVVALTYEISQEEAQKPATKTEAEQPTAETTTEEKQLSDPPSEPVKDAGAEEESVEPVASTSKLSDAEARSEIEESTPAEEDLEPLDVQLVREAHAETQAEPKSTPVAESSSSLKDEPAPQEANGPVYDDPSSDDDGEGEWITPSNVSYHKSRALDFLPNSSGGKKRGGDEEEQIPAGCMTADFAMQNVLLQMGLNLVGTAGKKIERVKTWVLRCHACYKICKDNSKKFCPSCGNPSLIRASVTISSPNASSTSEPEMQVHLKSNFQYRLRGTKYSIPAPKTGSAKSGNTGEGLVLREDQNEWTRAKKMADGDRKSVV